MKTYTIRLQKYDDLLTIQDKITWSNTARVILVFPDRTQIISNRLDFIRIQRFSKEKGYQIAAVIKDDEMGAEAKKAGLVVFNTLEDAQKKGWKKTYAPKFETKSHPGITEIWRYFKEKRRSIEPRPNHLILSMLLIAFALTGLLIFMVPGADVILQTDHREQNLTLKVAASPKYAAISGGVLMPARMESIEVSTQGTTNTSGEVGIPADFAQGEIRLINLSKERVVIPVGTVVLASSDPTKRYQVLHEVAVEADTPTGITVGIKSTIPGETFNAAAGTIDAIESEMGLNLKVNNENPVGGGKDLKVKAATQKDYAQLKQKLLNELAQKAILGIKSKLQNGEMLPGSMVSAPQIIKEEKSIELGQPAETVSLTINAVFEGWVIKSKNLDEIAATALTLRIPDGFEAVPGTLKVEILDKPVPSENDLTWTIKAEQEIRQNIESGKVRQFLAGKTVSQTMQELQNQYHLKSSPITRNFPTWWPMMPFYFMRIYVVVE
jgi:hypothetical protein